MTNLFIGAVLWIFTGLGVTAVWSAVFVWAVLGQEHEIAKRRYHNILMKIDAILPDWNHVLARWFYRVAAAVGFPEPSRRAAADVLSFTVGWPWVVPLIGEVVYEYWNDKAEE